MRRQPTRNLRIGDTEQGLFIACRSLQADPPAFGIRPDIGTQSRLGLFDQNHALHRLDRALDLRGNRIGRGQGQINLAALIIGHT